MEQITSRQNPLILRLRRLSSGRKERREEGVFLCEGPKMLSEALRWGAEINTVLLTDKASLPPLPESARAALVPEDLLRSVARTETPQGVVFLCRGKSMALPEKLTGTRYLVLDGVQDPGNVGTIWRTADAFGADALILLPGCADPWNPKTVRATMGAVFRLPVYETELPGLEARLAAADIPLYAAALREDTADVREISFDRAAAVIGSEGRGVSSQVLERCAKTVKIPMRETCESLNAAVAAAVVLWEMAR